MNSSLLTSRLDAVLFLVPAVEAFGWTLLHFVWQGTLVALAFGCFLAFSQRTSPRVRYAVGCAALSLMALVAVSTFFWQVQTRHVQAARQPVAPPIVALLPEGDAESRALHEPIRREIVKIRPRFVGHESALDVQPTRVLSTLAAPAVIPSAVEFDSLTTERAQPPDRLRPWLYRLVGLWVVGVVLLSVRLAAGWRLIGRLRAQGQHKNDSVWCARFACLKQRIGVSAPVQLLWSASTTVPMVIGWARPVVLVPAALLTGLSASQLEAVLAHELAHIRRHDYLVNLLQNVLETLLFYHPAVWWISEQVRNEREHCCDDLAAAACGGTLKYARALTALAELRHTSGSLGLAVTGGSLVARVARLAGIRPTGPRIGGPLPLLVLVGTALSAFLAANVSTRSDDARIAVGSSSKEAAPRRISESKPEASKTSKLTGTEVVAQVNGEKILASELYERAGSTPLGPSQLSLVDAANELKAGTLREDKHRQLKEIAYRELQEIAIRTYLGDFIRTRLLSQALLENLDKERTRQIETQISKMFEEYVRKLEKDLHVSTREQVDAKLHDQGTSLDHLRQEFRRRLLADEYLRKQQKSNPISRDAMEAYYRNHQSDYRLPEQVRWQLLEIRFERHGGREEALALAQKAAAELRRGKPFASVTRKYFDDVPAEQGGVFTRRTVAGPLPRPQHDWWTQLNSSNDEELTAAIHQIAAGEDVKRVFNRPEWSTTGYRLQPGSTAHIEGTMQVTEAGDGALANRSVQSQRTPSRIRRIHIHSRRGTDFNIVSRPVPNRTPPGQVTILTGGATVLIEDVDKRKGRKPVGTVELSAERMVIWSQAKLKSGVDHGWGVVQFEDEPLRVYLEGNAVISQSDPGNSGVIRKVDAKRAIFNPRSHMYCVDNTECETELHSTKGTGDWAERILQRGREMVLWKSDSVFLSSLENPSYRIPAADTNLKLGSDLTTNKADSAALEVVSRGAKNPRPNAAADKAARKDFDTCRTLDWTTPTNLVDRHLSAVLKQLAPGETSYVLERADSFRIVRVTERRPGGCKPFDEVEPSIRRKLEQEVLQRTIEDVYHKATIESPYLPGSQAKSPKKSEPASSMNDPSFELFQYDLYEGLNVPETAAHRNCS
jgi:beta-lactamase regulating signal transducer with metallopeptidase domain